MGPYTDIYVLHKGRSDKVIINFLNKFLCNYVASADEYEIPQYSSNPILTFNKAKDLMSYCKDNLNESHTIYWSNKLEVDPKHAMVFYTNDSHMILGLSINNEMLANGYLEQMKTFLTSKIGCILVETPAPENSIEFKNICNDQKT